MKKMISFVAALFLAGLAAGCDKPNPSSGAPAAGASAPSTPGGNTLAVVDLDRVAKAMGWLDEMNRRAQTAQQELRTALDNRVNTARLNYEQRKKDVAAQAHLTPDQVTALNKARAGADLEKLGLTPEQINSLIEANSVFAQAANTESATYNQVMSNYVAQIRVAYREALSPVVRRVATANGRSAVFTYPNDNILYYDPSADLTDKVIDDLQKSPALKPTIPELPRFDLSATQPAIPTTGPTTFPATRP